MGTIARQSAAPYTNGDDLHGRRDLEVDIATAFAEINGRLENVNFATSITDPIDADDKFADASVPASKFSNDQATTGKMVAGAVPRHGVSLATSETLYTTDATVSDWAGVSDITKTLAVDDMVLMDFEATIDPGVTGSGLVTLSWNVDSTAVTSPTFTLFIGGTVGDLHKDDHVIKGTYAFLVSTAGSVAMKPQSTVSSGLFGATVDVESAVFRVMVLQGLPEGTPGSGR